MFRQTLTRLVPVSNAIVSQLPRSFGLSAVAAQQANLDPIQQLFVDKIREYRSKSSGGKLVDASPESEASLKDMLGNLERAFGAKGIDMTQFPTFNFAEPTLVWPGLTAEQLQKVKENVVAEAEKEKQKLAEKAEEEKIERWYE